MAREARVLILVNSDVKVQLDDDVAAWIDYEKRHLDIDLKVDIKTVTIAPLTHKSFINQITGTNTADGSPIYTEMFGLDNIKAQIRQLGIVPEYTYQAVIFVYDLTITPWYQLEPQKALTQVGNWCYFDPIVPGTNFIELVVTPTWPENDPMRVMSHEFRHGTVSRIRLLGIPLPDVMDSTPVPIDCMTQMPTPGGSCAKFMPYWKEYDVEALDGNRATENALLRPYLDMLFSVPSPEKANRLSYLRQMLADLYAKLASMTAVKDSPNLEKWANAGKEHEGWYVGSRSYRNNNPGNFRYPQGSTYMRDLGAVGRDKDSFAIFPNYETGWKALLQFLRDAQGNKLVSYRAYAHKKARPNDMCTLGDFYAVYAPSTDGNNPLNYAKTVADKIGSGVTVDTPLNRI